MIYKILRIAWLLINWLELALFTTLLYVMSYLPSRLLGDYYFHLFRAWCRTFVHALGVDLRLHQKHKRPLPEQYILIANHPSAFEDIGIPALFNVYSLAKADVAKWWLVGRINQATGTLFVKRVSKASRKAAHDNLITELKKGHNIALYPEGGCKGRRIHESFRYGAFDISLATGIPIVPVFLHYEAQQDFEWQEPFTLIDKIWHMITTQNNHANYYVYDALDPKDFSDKESYTQYAHGLYLQWQEKYLT